MELVRSAPSPVATAARPVAHPRRVDSRGLPRPDGVPHAVRGEAHPAFHSDPASELGGLHGTVGERRVWRIACGDVINRDRCLTVLVEKDRVVLVGPPGETAVLTAGQLGQLRTALREAAEQAER
ncbi:hypothetical protein [Actinokineospora enzanensis]|uniref:hypothetical protein n=1 Tax=Actinokineospora enzanensis TaxID=155975 RepID=UPI000366E69D|nr:hypothetical protein [Actinokineospora enzanensis]